MKFFLFFLFTLNAYAIEFGDGSLGACTDATFGTSGGTYNCDSVTVTGVVTISAGQPALIILARDSIDITGSIILAVQNGNNGTNVASVDIDGGLAGAGGGKGGDFKGNFPASEVNGRAAEGSHPGQGGLGNILASNDGGGGGGGGNGQAGNAGTNGTLSGGSGGAKASSISAGSGGGAGGAGNDSGITTHSAGAGGGGGGFITLRAASTVSISGTVSANGGDGGSGNTASGGGGGGSGGTLLIQAVSGANLNGTINLAGGNGGNGGVPGVGGAGGVGRLIVQTSGAANVNTGGLSLTGGVTIERGDLFTNEFEGKIASGCGSIDLDGSSNFFPSFLLMLLIFLSLPTITKIKHQ